MISLTVSGHFDAAHFLPDYDGECANLHGHRWEVMVKVSGNTLQPNGILVDFKDIKATWKKYDHRNLNDFFAHPTAEHIARVIYDDLHQFPSIDVEYVRVWESPDACAEVTE